MKRNVESWWKSALSRIDDPKVSPVILNDEYPAKYWKIRWQWMKSVQERWNRAMQRDYNGGWRRRKSQRPKMAGGPLWAGLMMMAVKERERERERETRHHLFRLPNWGPSFPVCRETAPAPSDGADIGDAARGVLYRESLGVSLRATKQRGPVAAINTRPERKKEERKWDKRTGGAWAMASFSLRNLSTAADDNESDSTNRPNQRRPLSSTMAVSRSVSVCVCVCPPPVSILN